MICPQCRAEYRQGFTVCADCDIPLVPQYETATTLEAPEPPAEPGDPNQDPFCAFWKGDDRRLHAELTSILDVADIPHKTVRRQDHLFNLNNYPAFQIAVPFSFYERAERAIKEAFDLDASDPDAVQSLTASPLPSGTYGRNHKLPALLSPPADDAIPGPPSAGEASDLFPEDANAPVWSGDDLSLQEMLTASLNENKIFCRLETTGERATILVQPADEAPARKIVGEVCEASPPS
ncbi:MAG: hypothetical protein JWO71_446 [Candidatus Acidoferrum typicum]|nr:hypothetical protein [Candidatus Acidoferrum typicum]